MNYRDRLSKEITLPSGSTLTIHKVNVYDTAYSDGGGIDEQKGARIARYLMTQKTGKIDGVFSIVDKAKPDDPSTELTIAELDQLDAEFIVQQIMDFSGMTKRGEEARKTFPEGEKKNGTERAQTGANLPRTPTNGLVETAS